MNAPVLALRCIATDPSTWAAFSELLSAAQIVLGARGEVGATTLTLLGAAAAASEAGSLQCCACYPQPVGAA